MRVLMLPTLEQVKGHESGITRVIEAYYRYMPALGIEFVASAEEQHDVLAIHAGTALYTTSNAPLVAISHGLYWTADYSCSQWEWKANADVIDSLRHAYRITVPSTWVAETLQRDMRVNPHVVGHGIDWWDYRYEESREQYVLWNKNRTTDVCSPEVVRSLAGRFPSVRFVTTFYAPLLPNEPSPENVTVTGILEHDTMKRLIQKSGVYLSTTKETFGIGALEAMAAGVPVLGYAHGGNLDLISHGVNGYLARVNDIDDLSIGLEYCLQHRQVLGDNGAIMARDFTWERAARAMKMVFELAIADHAREHRPFRLESGAHVHD